MAKKKKKKKKSKLSEAAGLLGASGWLGKSGKERRAAVTARFADLKWLRAWKRKRWPKGGK